MHKIFIASGIMLIIVGILIWLGFDVTKYIGKLPGDIRVERPQFTFYFPITTMIILSILAHFLIRVFRWLNN